MILEAVIIYHLETVASLHTSRHTHVEVCGRVSLVRKEEDGDIHIRLSDDEGRFIIAEIVPYRPLPKPKLNQNICVLGIHRYDAEHGWDEVHPVESIRDADKRRRDKVHSDRERR